MAKTRSKDDDHLVEIKKAMATKKAILGTKKSLEGLHAGKLIAIYLSANCPANVVAEVEHRNRLAGITVHRIPTQSDELGVICKKPFSISVLGVLK